MTMISELEVVAEREVDAWGSPPSLGLGLRVARDQKVVHCAVGDSSCASSKFVLEFTAEIVKPHQVLTS